jgi:L-aminopeptidase/D-esterase-like protein
LIAVGVQLWGIRGAAAVHVVSLCMLATAYAAWGGRTLGLTPGGIAAALRGISTCVLAQAVATAAAALAIRAAGGGALAAGLVGAGAGALTLALMLRTQARDLLDEGRGVVYAAINRQPA